ncbi:class I SAM-dependent DNA methyltransferase [Maritalea sp. S77]|uniref:class I SAM-dependent DNA methyltransferase n=1 Tax=Maritalea sp. S77 TaxID=3415125 RepID=UPI003C7AB125
MTPSEFIKKWRNVELKERTASQSHFNDICRLLNIEDPIAADPKGEWFTFEKGASKTSGGEGWADVWRKNSFAWEYKGKRANLDKAFDQLLQYAIALENPPLLIVSDMDVIRIHTNWTNTVQKVYTIHLDDLSDAANRELLRNAFDAPERLKPSKTRQQVTEQAAQKFANMAQRLRDRGHDAQEVAHFVNRLVFCMFAEDVDLLPNKMFERMIKAALPDPATFSSHAQLLFVAMQKRGGLVGFEKVAWFNGGLFDSDAVLPLEKDDLNDLVDAAKLDWSDIDPAILGTLFERGLNPAKRSQLGAHYTDRDKIMQIVNPVIVQPLLGEWAAVRAEIQLTLANAPKQTKQKLLRGAELAASTRAHRKAEKLLSEFIERLKNFRVLDPACGSGNFLYIALLELKNIEHRANLEAEALGLSRGFPQIGPEVVLGIELSAYAAELARISVWIGEIQWMRRNGFEGNRNPILRTLNTIENRDAVLNENGTQAEWPKADVVIGNPPFLGDKRMIAELGESYVQKLRAAHKNDVPGGANFVCYWIYHANKLAANAGAERVGLVTTNAVRTGADRKVLETFTRTAEIFEAWSDEPWIVDGASVRVSIICFSNAPQPKRLNGNTVNIITPSLSAFPQPMPVALQENARGSFTGVFLNGAFEIEQAKAINWLKAPLNVSGSYNSDVLRLTANGEDLLQRGEVKWLLDFGADIGEDEAALYELPFEYALRKIKPFRQRKNDDGEYVVRRKNHRERWWIHAEPRPGMRRAIGSLSRFLVTPMVSSTRIFRFLCAAYLPNQKLVVFPRDDYTSLGILSSICHETWTLEYCSWIGAGNDPTYSANSVFQTFPFPKGLTPNIPAKDYVNDPRAIRIADAARRLDELRDNWLNPADLIVRMPEVVQGYPDRILPKDDASAKELKKRTLTNLYNARPTWLDNAHKALDEAVAEAYGWGDDWRDGKLTEDEILARLFKLNQERAKVEAKTTSKAKSKIKGRRKTKK